MVWVDKNGRLTGPPLRSPSGSAVAASVLAPLATGVLLFCAGFLVHRVLERRRLVAWDADWRGSGSGPGYRPRHGYRSPGAGS